MNDALAWMVLSQIPGIGNATFWSLVKRFGSPEEVLQVPGEKLQEITGLNRKQLLGFQQRGEVRHSCLEQISKLEKQHAICLTFENRLYPELLRQISDPPPLLYVLGNPDLLSECCIAVVGSRAATSYGTRAAHVLAKRLAGAGVTIVSGLALGIDAESHQGALAAEGNTIGVLGCGIDVVYPRQHAELYRRISEKGALVSEYPLGTPPEGFRFPARNRIIAGLSRGVIVVEAARKSGSLITAQLALDNGREVYGVPGQIDSFKSEGVHWLLQQGAKLVQSENDILEDLSIAGTVFGAVPFASSSEADQNLEPDARHLLENIETYPQAREELLLKSGMQIAAFSESLLLLELDGLIEVLPGDEIRRVG